MDTAPDGGAIVKYIYALVHKDTGSAFGISFPGLPGCFSAADQADDVVQMATEALGLWLEEAGEVEPLSLDQVRADAAADLAQGAFLIAIPCP